VALVVVDVMLKPEILDPAGQAVLGALGAGDATGGELPILGVRIGKRIELSLAGPVEAAGLEQLHHLAATLLSNPVIEDYTLRVE
jgi:phosphoribosylformylglycinamidine synthase PurS subunit